MLTQMAPSYPFALAAVFGYPVMHSRSPLMHQALMAQQGIQGAYLPLEVHPDRLESALRGLEPLNFAGCNLTIPLKQKALEIVDEVDEVARAIGAISCVVVRADGSLFGTNNDWIGFRENLLSQWQNWAAGQGPVLVIGGGGGCRAITYALVQMGFTEILLCNRTEARADEIAYRYPNLVQVIPWHARHERLASVSLLVNTTNQGMVVEAPLYLRLDALPTHARVADIIYTHLDSPLILDAAVRGHPTANGLGMLLHQARPAWQLWFGRDPEISAEIRAMMETEIKLALG